MTKLKQFAVQRPVLFSLLVILLGIFLTELPLKEVFAPYIGVQPAHYLAFILEQGITGLLFFLLLVRFGWLEKAGFTHPKKWQALWLGWPLLLFMVINLDVSINPVSGLYTHSSQSPGMGTGSSATLSSQIW